jgi:hypothetical protein
VAFYIGVCIDGPQWPHAAPKTRRGGPRATGGSTARGSCLCLQVASGQNCSEVHVRAEAEVWLWVEPNVGLGAAKLQIEVGGEAKVQAELVAQLEVLVEVWVVA